MNDPEHPKAGELGREADSESADFAVQPPADELDWARVLAWLPTLTDPDFDPGPGPELTADADGHHHVRSGGLSETARAFVAELYDAEVVAGFDWSAWMAAYGRRLASDPSALAAASLEDCRRLLVAHVRGDRFIEGHLGSALRDGQVQAILTRVDRLWNGR